MMMWIAIAAASLDIDATEGLDDTTSAEAAWFCSSKDSYREGALSCLTQVEAPTHQERCSEMAALRDKACSVFGQASKGCKGPREDHESQCTSRTGQTQDWKFVERTGSVDNPHVAISATRQLLDDNDMSSNSQPGQQAHLARPSRAQPARSLLGAASQVAFEAVAERAWADVLTDPVGTMGVFGYPHFKYDKIGDHGWNLLLLNLEQTTQPEGNPVNAETIAFNYENIRCIHKAGWTPSRSTNPDRGIFVSYAKLACTDTNRKHWKSFKILAGVAEQKPFDNWAWWHCTTKKVLEVCKHVAPALRALTPTEIKTDNFVKTVFAIQ